MQGGPGFLVKAGKLQRLFVPANRHFGYAFVQKTLRQPGVCLHDLRERMAMLDTLADFLQLTNRLVEQTHLAEGDPEVVVGLGILVGARATFLKLLFQLSEQVGQINSGSGLVFWLRIRRNLLLMARSPEMRSRSRRVCYGSCCCCPSYGDMVAGSGAGLHGIHRNLRSEICAEGSFKI